MDSVVLDMQNILDCLSLGIVIVDDQLKILFQNRLMQKFECEDCTQRGGSLLELFPGFNVPYFQVTLMDALEHGCSLFFSAAMHENLLNCREKCNIKVTRFMENSQKRLLLEFMEVTDSFERIRQLRESVSELRRLNRELEQKERAIQQLAYYDHLTGVANRTLFYELAEKFLYAAQRNHEIGRAHV